MKLANRILKLKALALILPAAVVFSAWIAALPEVVAADPPKPRLITLRAGKFDAQTHLGAPLEYQRAVNANASVENHFDPTFKGFEGADDAKAVFQTAFRIWSTLIDTDVKIKVNVNWKSLDANVLGSAGPSTFVNSKDHPSVAWPKADSWYPVALANKVAKSDLAPSDADIESNFNKDFPNWYTNVDGLTPAGKYDLLSVVLHELCHGLGFIGTFDVQGSVGSWGAGTAYPMIFDRFAIDGGSPANLLLDPSKFSNDSTALANLLQGGKVFFQGPTASAANGSTPVPLYAPNPWEDGSSFSHLNEASYPAGNANSLMTPQLGLSESIHSPGPVGLGVLRDLGW